MEKKAPEVNVLDPFYPYLELKIGEKRVVLQRPNGETEIAFGVFLRQMARVDLEQWRATDDYQLIAESLKRDIDAGEYDYGGPVFMKAMYNPGKGYRFFYHLFQQKDETNHIPNSDPVTPEEVQGWMRIRDVRGAILECYTMVNQKTPTIALLGKEGSEKGNEG